jgi:pimeloyl-ACP methyl ester carboxylesterase
MRMHNALPDSEVTVLPNCSHMAMYEDPPAYLARVAAFLDARRRGRKT